MIGNDVGPRGSLLVVIRYILIPLQYLSKSPLKLRWYHIPPIAIVYPNKMYRNHLTSLIRLPSVCYIDRQDRVCR